MTHMTDGVTDDMVWIQGTRMPWFNTRLGHLKKEKRAYILYMYYIYCIKYILYISICILYILYIAYICRIKSEWYMNRNSFTTYIG